LTDGNRFDANENKENPFKFTIGVGQVIKGWDIGMATMKRGERSVFTIEHEYAYGENG
jgi:FKBP-type peptidyl-prolyl cis-trans isomerase